MPKVIMEFNIPEESQELELAQNGVTFSIVISDLDNELRAHIKYGANPEWDTKTVEDIRQLLNRLLNERNVVHLT